MVAHFKTDPDHWHIPLLGSPSDVIVQQLYVEADEVCSYMGKKANKQWRWMAMETKTRQIMAFHVGDRRRKRAEQLWTKIPVADCELGTCFTDRYEAYKGVMPTAQHKAIHKLARKTNHLDRVNNTLCQRVSHLVRDPLACLKHLAHHSGAIKFFIGEDNLTRVAAFLG
jgi:insertion element IS1 protein InsB